MFPVSRSFLLGMIRDLSRTSEAKEKRARSWDFILLRKKSNHRFRKLRLLSMIDAFNRDPKIHGILVQLPLPKHINEQKIIEAISPEKDVDGFHPISIGRMMIGAETFYPVHTCWHLGIVETQQHQSVRQSMLLSSGRSNIVGKPIANILDAEKRVVQRDCHYRAHRSARSQLLHSPGGYPYRSNWKSPCDHLVNGEAGSCRHRRRASIGLMIRPRKPVIASSAMLILMALKKLRARLLLFPAALVR